MCGIVGAIGQRKVSDILIEGLKRLEYRGYDSAGMAVIDKKKEKINCVKTVGKVAALEQAVADGSAKGTLGIAHTRWATHGKPSEINAHPHCSSDSLALVHNGIIENYLALKQELMAKGYEFATETDSETIVHLIHAESKENSIGLVEAVKNVVNKLEGAYGLAVISKDEKDKIVVARSGSPLIIGVGIGENFIASDPSALGQVTDRFIYLEEGDIAEVTNKKITIWNAGEEIKRNIVRLHDEMEDASKGEYRHFMLKEIFEQKTAIKNTLAGKLSKTHVLEQAFGIEAQETFRSHRS